MLESQRRGKRTELGEHPSTVLQLFPTVLTRKNSWYEPDTKTLRTFPRNFSLNLRRFWQLGEPEFYVACCRTETPFALSMNTPLVESASCAMIIPPRVPISVDCGFGPRTRHHRKIPLLCLEDIP